MSVSHHGRDMTGALLQGYSEDSVGTVPGAQEALSR